MYILYIILFLAVGGGIYYVIITQKNKQKSGAPLLPLLTLNLIRVCRPRAIHSHCSIVHSLLARRFDY